MTGGGKGKKRKGAGASAGTSSGSTKALKGRAEPNHSGGSSKPPSKAFDNTFEPGLYIVATPIGNARDVTLRALDLLAAADVIACEDTRVTAKLLAIHGIRTSLTPYHEHNAEKARPRLIKRLKSGEIVALASDAGTPLVSDPGYKLVRACLEEAICVTALPGASAVLAALTLSGLPSDRFLFTGFLPNRKAARRKALIELKAIPATLVIMESAKRLAAAINDMAYVLGGRAAAVGRELTKKFEDVRRGSLHELSAHYAEHGPPRGEVMVVVAPPGADEKAGAVDGPELDAMINRALEGASLRDAADRVSAETGVARNRVYTRALELTSRR